MPRVFPGALILLCVATALSADSRPADAIQVTAPVLIDLPLRDSSYVSWETFREYVISRDRFADPIYLRAVHSAYVKATQAEGVSLVVSLAQMIHETDFLRFTGAVSAVQYNFAGIGSIAHGVAGDRFPDVTTGVLAHVQHIRAYSDRDPLALPLVDPRFSLVQRGSATTVRGLTGRWATDPAYAEKILVHANRLLELQRAYGRPLRHRL